MECKVGKGLKFANVEGFGNSGARPPKEEPGFCHLAPEIFLLLGSYS